MNKIRGMVLFSMIVLAISCKNPFYAKVEQQTTEHVSAGLCVLTAQTDGSIARSAFPSSVGTLKYYAVIKAPDGKYLTDNVSTPVSESIVFLENKASVPSLNFMFVSCAQAGNYTITVYGFSESATAPTASSYKHYTASVEVTKNLAAHAMKIDLGTLVLKGNTEQNAAKGKVNLPISIDTSIKRIELIVARNGGDSLPAEEGLVADLSGSPKTIKHKGAGISPGIYTVTIKAFDATSGGKQIFLQNPVQTITVFSGCETNTWYGIDGNPLAAGLVIQPIDTNAANTLFVKGTGGALSITGSDANTGISLGSPLASLNAAIAKCTGDSPYTIYVDGTVTEPDPLSQFRIYKQVTVKSLSERATIKKADDFTKSLIIIDSRGSLTLENIILDGAGIGYTGIGGLVYNEGALTLKDGTVLQNGKADNGGAVYSKGTFTINGNATVTPSDNNAKGNNDVYLDNNAKITVAGTLSPHGGIAAHITVPDDKYQTGTQVLAAATGINLANETGKFTVTPQTLSDGTTLYWEVDAAGKLMCIVDGAKPNAWKLLKDTVAKAGNNDTIFIKGEIKATNSVGNSGGITINKNLTIKKADGTATAVINANCNHTGAPPFGAPTTEYRIFDVESSKTLTLENLTLKNGKKGGATGGGIFVTGTVKLSNCIIENCKAAQGGAIGGTGTITLTATKVSNCEATSNSLGGGAIYTKGGTVTITNCTLTGNTAAQNGGAIYAEKTDIGSNPAATVTIKGGIIGGDGTAGNKVTDQYGFGGGIFVNDGCILTLDKYTDGSGTQIIGNQAGRAGGVRANNSTVTMIGCTIRGNKSTDAANTGGGGGVYIQGNTSGQPITMTDCTIQGNTAAAYGGGVCIEKGTITLKNCTIKGNTAKFGGGIYVRKIDSNASTVTISDNTIIGGTNTNDANKATGTDGYGGGIYINNSTLKLQNNAKVIGNKASVRGGGIYVGGTDANFTMESGEISSNTVTITESAEIQGGGVCVIDGAKFEMKGGSIKNNTVIAAAADNAKARGGGVCVSGSGSTFIMKDGNPEIINNEVTKADSSDSSMKITTIGGGICVWDNAKFEMQQGTISGNKALEGSGINYFTGAGGGVCVGGKGNADGEGYTNDTAEFKMSGGTISKNEASSNGGGVAVTSNAKFIMTNGTIGGSEADKNTSKQRGGGVAVLHGTFEMQNSTVSYNQATGSSGAGGGVYGMNFNSNKGSIIIKGSSSISNNTAMSSGTLAGGGIDGSYKLTIEGDVKIMNNKAPKGFGGGIACSQDAQVELKGCTVEGNTAKEPQYGHGVYISYFNNTNTYFKMSGNTKIHKDNNVVLGSSSSSEHPFITVTGALSIDDTDYYPSLTMNTDSGYSLNRVVVKPGGSYILQESDISKFKVTPGGTPQKNWKIVLEGGVGKLKTDP